MHVDKMMKPTHREYHLLQKKKEKTLGISLLKLSKLTKPKALINKDHDLAQKVTDFHDVHKEWWCDLISTTAAQNREEVKWNSHTLLPFTKYVQKLHAFLNKT